MNMRKKPSQGGSYNHHGKRPRHSQGGGSHGHSNGNRPKRNYGAAREKYLAQARDALAAGDRVLAESYLQHADHYYRMMVEEGERFNSQRPQTAANGEEAPATQDSGEDIEIPLNSSSLPAFLTGGYEHAAAEGAEAPPVQNWEERDNG
ncbi:MAG: DUF4167 domain-containing protein [Rickettsiales bacterium]|nr:DUF4167 domain-containing protein [Rickettsiales bacterium]